jgi:hypothetical protein
MGQVRSGSYLPEFVFLQLQLLFFDHHSKHTLLMVIHQFPKGALLLQAAYDRMFL